MAKAQSTDNSFQGMVLVASAMLYIPVLDLFSKLLVDDYSPVQVSWFRFLFQVVILLPFVFYRTGIPKFHNPIALISRGIMMALASVCMVFGLRFMPIADCITLFFVEPLILTILSALFLGETIGPRRIIAVLVGFAGAGIALQPSFEDVGFAVLFPLATAFFFACYLALTRYFALKEDPITMQCLSGGVSMITLSLFMVIGIYADLDYAAYKPLDFDHIWLILALGIIATISHLQMVMGYRLAEAGLLAPFQYLEIIGAVILGYIFFDDFPEGITWLGIIIICGSGIYVFYRERKNKTVQ